MERTTARNPQVQQHYDQFRANMLRQYGTNAPCPLCRVEGHEQIDATRSMLVLANLYPYEYLDGRFVDAHYMIVPRRHVNSLGHFTRREQKDYWRLLQKYQDAGYASLTRANGDKMRSVPSHLHTHLVTYAD